MVDYLVLLAVVGALAWYFGLSKSVIAGLFVLITAAVSLSKWMSRPPRVVKPRDYRWGNSTFQR